MEKPHSIVTVTPERKTNPAVLMAVIMSCVALIVSLTHVEVRTYKD